MAEKPILFSAPMVRAILDGRKTQTRRIVKPQPSHDQVHEWNGRTVYDGEERLWCWRGTVLGDDLWDYPNGDARAALVARCPYGAPGDRLWVKETHAVNVPGCERGLSYRADHHDPKGDGPANPMRWKPSIHMRRCYSRLTLEVTEVRVERLRDITESDAKAEGAPCIDEASGREVLFPEATNVGSYRLGFRSLWESINGAKSLADNPWVWVVSFRKLEVTNA